MKLLATEDVPSEALAAFRAELLTERLDSSEQGRYFLKSVDGPSWVRLIAELSWWQQTLGAMGTLYVAELVKEAAKETWKSRASVLAATVKAVGTLKGLAAAIYRLKLQISSRTKVVVGIPEPQEYFGAHFDLSLESQSQTEVELALFVHYLPAVSRLIADHRASGERAAAGYFLELQDSGSLLVWWQDSETLKRYEMLISLTACEV